MNFFIKSTKFGKENFETLNEDSFSKTEMFKVVNSEDFDGPVDLYTLKNYVDESNLDVLIVNQTLSPKIVKLIDMKKYIYDLKKSKKENDKKQKALIEKEKEIRFQLNIADHDLIMKINHAKEFLEKNIKVKFSLKLKGRENSDAGKMMGRKLFDRILEELHMYSHGEVKNSCNNFYVDVRKA